MPLDPGRSLVVPGSPISIDDVDIRPEGPDSRQPKLETTKSGYRPPVFSRRLDTDENEVFLISLPYVFFPQFQIDILREFAASYPTKQVDFKVYQSDRPVFAPIPKLAHPSWQHSLFLAPKSIWPVLCDFSSSLQIVDRSKRWFVAFGVQTLDSWVRADWNPASSLAPQTCRLHVLGFGDCDGFVALRNGARPSDPCVPFYTPSPDPRIRRMAVAALNEDPVGFAAASEHPILPPTGHRDVSMKEALRAFERRRR